MDPIALLQNVCRDLGNDYLWLKGLGVFVAWLLSVCLGACCIRGAYTAFGQRTHVDLSSGGSALVSALGAVERTLYFGSAGLGKPEGIAVWLVFKAASQWGRGPVTATTKVSLLNNASLVGNGLSIAWGVTPGAVLRWAISEPRYSEIWFLVVLLASAGLMGFTWLLPTLVPETAAARAARDVHRKIEGTAKG